MELEIIRSDNKYSVKIVTIDKDILEIECDKVILNNKIAQLEYLYVSKHIKILVQGKEIYVKTR